MMAHNKPCALAIRMGTLLLGGLLLLCACAPQSITRSKERYANREESFKLLDDGKRLEKEGSPMLALERYDRAAKIYETAEAWFLQGRIFESLGKKREAATAYKRALELAPDYQEARLAILALGYAPPGSKPTEQELAQAKVRAGQERPVTQDPKTTDSATTDSTFTDLTATTSTSTTSTAAVVQSNQESDQADEQKAASPEQIQSERKDVVKEAAQKRMPTETDVRNVLFAAETSQEKLPSATKPVYASDQDIILGSYPYHYQKAESLRRRQQYEKAAEEYERAIQADPKQIQALLDLGDLMLRLERAQRARIYYEKAQQSFPESAKPLLKMGNYYMNLKQSDKAREYYRKALDKDPQYVEAYNNLAVLDMQERKYAEATKLLDEIIKLDPTYQNAYLNRGIIASDVEHDHAAALRNYKKYVELNGPRAAQVRKWVDEIENPER